MNHPPLLARDCVRRITQESTLPLLVDADTGWGGALMIARTIREISRAGAAGCHLEDQVQAKRCGHRPGKELVSAGEMGDRIKAAVDARTDEQFVIMARTDAHASEGLDAAIERAQADVAAGADMIFAEALTNLDEYRAFSDAVNVLMQSLKIAVFRVRSRISTFPERLCRMRLDLALDSLAIFAFGTQQIIFQLEAEPEVVRAWGLRKGACVFILDSVAIDDFDFMTVVFAMA